MKKILIAVILFCSLGGFAQINIKQGFGVEYYFDNNTTLIQGDRLQSSDGVKLVNKLNYNRGSFACAYKFKVEYNSFSINALTSIYMNKGESYQFAPTHADFTINLIYKFNKISFKAEHKCKHDLISTYIPLVQMQGGYTKLGVYFNW